MLQTFREFYEEFKNFRNAKYLGIFKNPTEEEMDKMKGDVRAILLKNGDLYVGNVSETQDAIHDELEKRASELFKKAKTELGKAVMAPFHKNSLKNGMTLQRAGKTNQFLVGESDEDWALEKEHIPALKALFGKARKKNPKLRFIMKGITE